MKKRILIFESDLGGHRLEYLHHLHTSFCGAVDLGATYTFVVPESFDFERGGLSWATSEDVSLIRMTEQESIACSASRLSAYLAKFRVMKEYVKKTQSEHILLISLMGFLPSILLAGGFSVGGATASGIIYSIYTRNQRGRIYRLRSWLLFFLMARLPVFNSVFLLNDRASPRLFNREFKSAKFKYLPDPYVPLTEKLMQGGPVLSKDPAVTTLLHFGGLTSRKGTLEILKAAEILLSRPDAPKYRFVFAGKVYADIHDEFYALVQKLDPQVDIKVYDEFCDYGFLGKLCQESDCLLMPYKSVGQSSGLLGFAAQFGIPVITPSAGLLGKIMKDYKLGYTINHSDGTTIADAVCRLSLQVKSWNREINHDYLSQNSVVRFCRIIGNSL